jgi:hypothetical protein
MTRPTPEQIERIRRDAADGRYGTYYVRDLLAEVDALRAEHKELLATLTAIAIERAEEMKGSAVLVLDTDGWVSGHVEFVTTRGEPGLVSVYCDDGRGRRVEHPSKVVPVAACTQLAVKVAEAVREACAEVADGDHEGIASHIRYLPVAPIVERVTGRRP